MTPATAAGRALLERSIRFSHTIEGIETDEEEIGLIEREAAAAAVERLAEAEEFLYERRHGLKVPVRLWEEEVDAFLAAAPPAAPPPPIAIVQVDANPTPEQIERIRALYVLDVERLARALAQRHGMPHSRFSPPMTQNQDWSGTITSLSCSPVEHMAEAAAIVAAYERAGEEA